MGRSDPHVYNFYKHYIKPEGTTALLGFTNNNWYQGDLYDLQLNNWDINDEWELPRKYDTIICLRCPYFSKNPKDFISRCYDSLNDGGKLYVDWGLGDHWRFEEYKVGWVKNGEHEFAYSDNNYLWSTVWHKSFLEHPQFKLYKQRVEKYGYESVYTAIRQEVPSVFDLEEFEYFFDISYAMMALWDDSPQLYILTYGTKK